MRTSLGILRMRSSLLALEPDQKKLKGMEETRSRRKKPLR